MGPNGEGDWILDFNGANALYPSAIRSVCMDVCAQRDLFRGTWCTRGLPDGRGVVVNVLGALSPKGYLVGRGRGGFGVFILDCARELVGPDGYDNSLSKRLVGP